MGINTLKYIRLKEKYMRLTQIIDSAFYEAQIMELYHPMDEFQEIRATLGRKALSNRRNAIICPWEALCIRLPQ